MKEVFCDIAVVGAGPAGLAAAAAAQNSGAENIIIVEQDPRVGEILQKYIQAGFRLYQFGEEKSRSSQEKREASEVSCCLNSVVKQIRGKSLICITPDGVVQLHFSALILAIGGRGQTNLQTSCCPVNYYTTRTGIDGKDWRRPQGSKGVVILGSGDNSMILARRLTQGGIRIRAVLELAAELTGSAHRKEQCLDRFQIPLLLSHTVVDMVGTEPLESVTVAPVDVNGQVLMEKAIVIPCDRLLTPESDFNFLLSHNGERLLSRITEGIQVNRFGQTRIPWVFACGDLLRLHSTEDSTGLEAETVGRYAVLYAKGGLPFEPCSDRGEGARSSLGAVFLLSNMASRTGY